ncbi:TrkH family potassium uptake protein [Bacteroides sp. KH569_7]|uniref:TrkH family potassium uptake protein n=1 Tax=Bacteroides muris (ex Fokt et al. 2023) TaxID=2937417 RepID=A0A9X2P120_9BACE|nr:TrkH family potassium uptake protein [Bacteroides muris (ex Fokt et al. 2023)]
MIHKKMIYTVLGYLLLIETAMMTVCAGIALFYNENDLHAFLYAMGLTAGCGILLLTLGKGYERQLTRRDGYLIVSLAWVVFSLFGMLPFYLSGYIPNLSNAFFETMSGVSSTGATILDNIEALPHGLLFWRSMTQWIGGLGIILFTIAVLPIFGINGVQVFAAEASGPTHDKVHPRIGITARWIWLLYTGLTATATLFLSLGGMNWFDSICHAFAATGTGGFSTHTASIAYYNSPYIEYVLSAFMFVSGINFTLLLLFVTGRFKKTIGDTELRFYCYCIVGFTLGITAILYLKTPMELETAFRTSLFQVISIQTSTGFATSDYMTWPALAWGVMPMLMLVGACAGSTSGGIKCIRIVLLQRVTRNEFKRLLHPNAVLPIRLNKHVIPPTLQSTVLAFTFLFILIMFVSILILLALGIPFTETVGVVISSIGNTGPGLGAFGPAFSWNALPDTAKWLSSLLMLLGRLELFTVMLLFTPDFWKKN